MRSPRLARALRLVVVLAVLGACSSTERATASTKAPAFLVTRLGGTTSAREFRGRPFNQSARSLSNSEFQRFGTGAVVFDQRLTAAQGLGPTFNEDSCLGCHLDGVVFQPHTADDPGPGLLLRLSVPGTSPHGGPKPEPTYGTQLQTQALPGATAEGRLEVRWTARAGEYPDGTRYQLRVPTFYVTDLTAGPMAKDVMTSARISPPMTGMGLLEAIPEASVVAAADPTDANHDGISGRANRVWNDTTGQLDLGRFGWKAGQPTVRQQSVGALHDDMGITTSDVPTTCHNQGTACAEPAPAAPDMSDKDLADQVFYNRTIAVPIARNVDDDRVKRGANQFVAVGCASCHTTTQRSGPDQVAGLANQTFHPFTDLLLHDMGKGLADGRPEFAASGREWRTAPLWALGRRAETTKFHSLLHDGRARTPEEAILWHDGEGRASRLAFMKLAAADRADLLAFLAAL
ncbi:MAG: di-heme oxidoredictase family protein [Acidimicrobiales bacterium]